jgi:hypothetical protein
MVQSARRRSSACRTREPRPADQVPAHRWRLTQSRCRNLVVGSRSIQLQTLPQVLVHVRRKRALFAESLHSSMRSRHRIDAPITAPGGTAICPRVPCTETLREPRESGSAGRRDWPAASRADRHHRADSPSPVPSNTGVGVQSRTHLADSAKRTDHAGQSALTRSANATLSHELVHSCSP